VRHTRLRDDETCGVNVVLDRFGDVRLELVVADFDVVRAFVLPPLVAPEPQREASMTILAVCPEVVPRQFVGVHRVFRRTIRLTILHRVLDPTFLEVGVNGDRSARRIGTIPSAGWVQLNELRPCQVWSR
jgi:hypothetical protein